MQWYLKKYGVDVGKKKKGAAKEEKQDSNGRWQRRRKAMARSEV